ncbi:helix-turn-helix domain-containing protein [Urechidicola croceus]|uniref:helix-turn-helix domain-containing protein n=1 Tax=Urechidicola croceus TaxID=1850246 RepID=UPI000AC3B385|nr:helix-turn-helix domain-containing protein [Urechidicola croceus]
MSFDTVTSAVDCAKKIMEIYNFVITPDIEFRIGISAGIPVTDKESIFEDTIKMADRLCDTTIKNIAVSSEVKDLYESENLNIELSGEFLNVLNSSEERFINSLMDYIEKEWNNPTLSIDYFTKELGISKSQFYRKMIATTGKSLNVFLKEYRLIKALNLLNKNDENISEIAFQTGFNSPAYFSKRFQEVYGILPSVYSKQNTQ